MAWTNAIGWIMAAALLSALAVLGAKPILGVVLPTIGFIGFGLALQVRCPRCRLQVRSKIGFAGLGQSTSDTCERCGRTRRGVWPFEYLVAPEPWEADRH